MVRVSSLLQLWVLVDTHLMRGKVFLFSGAFLLPCSPGKPRGKITRCGVTAVTIKPRIHQGFSLHKPCWLIKTMDSGVFLGGCTWERSSYVSLKWESSRRRRTNEDWTSALLWKICFFTEERIFFSFLTEFVVGQSWILFGRGHSANVRDCIGLKGGDSLA